MERSGWEWREWRGGGKSDGEMGKEKGNGWARICKVKGPRARSHDQHFLPPHCDYLGSNRASRPRTHSVPSSFVQEYRFTYVDSGGGGSGGSHGNGDGQVRVKCTITSVG